MNLTKKLSYSEARDYIEKNKISLRKLYKEADATARKIAENQNIHYDSNFQKALFNVLGPKGKGLGGARHGSGNKRGTKFCPLCGKKMSATHEEKCKG